MTKKTITKLNRIPKFKNRKEEAAFWDTHSTADYETEFQSVKVQFAKNLSEGITIRLDKKTMNVVRTLAKDKGVGPTTLIRMWVLERLREKANRISAHI